MPGRLFVVTCHIIMHNKTLPCVSLRPLGESEEATLPEGDKPELYPRLIVLATLDGLIDGGPV